MAFEDAVRALIRDIDTFGKTHFERGKAVERKDANGAASLEDTATIQIARLEKDIRNLYYVD